MNVEFVKNLNTNYERILLKEQPEKNKYQYCMLNRGGIQYILPCSLRYINGLAYLYYDITSTQNITQIFLTKTMKREWMRHFLWGIDKMKHELERFLLEEKNIIWLPEQIYQDVERNDFYFTYIPYYKEEQGFEEMINFFVEHIDYEDEELVEFVYNLHEKYLEFGMSYLDKQMQEDFKKIDFKKEKNMDIKIQQVDVLKENTKENTKENITDIIQTENIGKEKVEKKEFIYLGKREEKAKKERKGLWFLKENKRKKEEEKLFYQEEIKSKVLGYSVCENSTYTEESKYHEKSMIHNIEETEYGRTQYIEEVVEEKESGLYKLNGELIASIVKYPFIIGKKKEDVNCILEEVSVSRIHARIIEEKNAIYIEDLNSTNGTFKNGLRLEPYERRVLEKGDELKFGKLDTIYK